MKLTKRARRSVSHSATSRADYVRDQIREAIRTGRYPPGERIRETEVAEWLGVSRTPVRESFRRLESEGLLNFVSWRGAVVANLDLQQVSELYAMRAVLEGAAAKLAAQHVEDAELFVLERTLASAEECEGDQNQMAEINRRFHNTIYAAAHNRYLTQTLENMRNSLALLRGTTFSVPGRMREATAEHRAIFEAIRNRNPDAAEMVARDHMAGAHRARLQLIIDIDRAGVKKAP